MMDLLRVTFGEDRILGKKFPQEEHIEEMRKQREEESDKQHAARMYMIKNMRDQEKLEESLKESKDMNPNGFWEMLYTVQGIYYRFHDADRLEKILVEEKKSICKIVSQGLMQSDPKYIDKVIYMIRHPRAVAKSQERLKRSWPLNSEPTVNGEPQPIHTPEMYVNVTTMASRWFLKYPEVQVHYVHFDELIEDPERILNGVQEFLGEGDFSKAINQINPKLRRSLPQDIDSPFWEDAEMVYKLFTEKNHQGVIDYMSDPSLTIHRKNKRIPCARVRNFRTEDQCLMCKTNRTTRDNFKKEAIRKNIYWYNEPCIFECAHDFDNELKTIEESIKNNFWVEKEVQEISVEGEPFYVVMDNDLIQEFTPGTSVL
jgi:hypothetical protein